MFYTNIVSCVIVNGNLSDWFYIHRGYRFILCAEILSILIKYNDNIKGIIVDADEFLLSQYADDTSLLLDGSENSLRSTMSVSQFYANISGLKINIEKTKAVWVDSSKEKRDGICQNLGITWESETFTLLGVTFSKYLTDMVDINYQLKLNDINKSAYQNESYPLLVRM